MLQSRAGRNNSGVVTVFSKGHLKKRNGVFSTNINMWNRGVGVITNVIRNRKKLASVIQYSTGSIVVNPHTSGAVLGQFVFSSVLPYKFWCNFKTSCIVLLKFLLKFSIVSNIAASGFAKYSTAAGTFCQILEIFVDYNLVKVVLPSKQVKIFSGWSFCILGRNSNVGNRFLIPGKAGFLKIVGKKSKVRGVARNPVDHPHGGRTKTNQPEVSIWGWIAKRNK